MTNTGVKTSITEIPAFSDNYIWKLRIDGHAGVYVVDPGDANAVEAALADDEHLAGILITHHHFDHTGGIAQLCESRNIPVFGPHNPAIKDINHRLKAGDEIEIDGLRLRILEIPGHTLDHIAYLTTNAEQASVFCGDTLFAGGCGRLFEGSPEQMLNSLQALAALDDATQVYAAHEYTQANLAFAKAVDGDNRDLLDRIDAVKSMREANQPTLPTSIGLERATNPFLRCHTDELIASAQGQSGMQDCDEVSVFAAIRRWKDNF